MFRHSENQAHHIRNNYNTFYQHEKYTVWTENVSHQQFAITSSITDRFALFFHWHRRNGGI